MKCIAYMLADRLCILRPMEGARLATSIHLDGGAVIASDQPIAADRFLQRWPMAGASANWAETEDEFTDRIRRTDVPADASEVRVVDESDIPKDRANRALWRLGPSGIIAG